MIPDTSALAAILFGEPEATRYTHLIHDADRCLISVANFVELCMVIESQIGPGCYGTKFVVFAGAPRSHAWAGLPGSLSE